MNLKNGPLVDLFIIIILLTSSSVIILIECQEVIQIQPQSTQLHDPSSPEYQHHDQDHQDHLQQILISSNRPNDLNSFSYNVVYEPDEFTYVPYQTFSNAPYVTWYFLFLKSNDSIAVVRVNDPFWLRDALWWWSTAGNTWWSLHPKSVQVPCTGLSLLSFHLRVISNLRRSFKRTVNKSSVQMRFSRMETRKPSLWRYETLKRIVTKELLRLMRVRIILLWRVGSSFLLTWNHSTRIINLFPLWDVTSCKKRLSHKDGYKQLFLKQKEDEHVIFKPIHGEFID